MRKIKTSVFMSLDGVMQAPGGPDEDPTGGFAHGGWVPTYWDDDLSEAMNETFKAPFDLLLGRKTYDIFAAHWPYAEQEIAEDDFEALNNDIARTFNRITKYVATHSPETLSWKGSEALGPDPVATLRGLKAQDGPDLFVQGSSDFSQTLLANDLIDEMQLLIFPITLGKGKRLFGEGAIPAAFKLTGSKITSNGVIIARYVHDGAVNTGSFAFETPTEAELERRRNLT